MSQDLQPFFEPGSGWYRMRGPTAPGSIRDLENKQAAAFRCVVFRMRHEGVRLAPADVLARHFVEGGLICNDDYTRPAWHAVLYALPDMKRALILMHDAKLKRARGGFRQYQGWEWDEKAMNKYTQTWFCAPNHEAGVSVLASMSAA